MHIQFLVDDIVRQTTVLIGQLATALRAPPPPSSRCVSNCARAPRSWPLSVEELTAEGKLHVRDGVLHPRRYEVPVGAEQGWETAICDHYRAASTIAAKVAAPRSSRDDVTGGATLSFGVHRGHPHATEVYRLLNDTRQRANALWSQVVAYNQQHPLPPEGDQVTFYCGQHAVAYEQTTGRDSETAE